MEVLAVKDDVTLQRIAVHNARLVVEDNLDLVICISEIQYRNTGLSRSCKMLTVA